MPIFQFIQKMGEAAGGSEAEGNIHKKMLLKISLLTERIVEKCTSEVGESADKY